MLTFFVVIVSGIFWYSPNYDGVKLYEIKKEDVISPELKECEVYRMKIEEKLKEVKNVK